MEKKSELSQLKPMFTIVGFHITSVKKLKLL